MYGKHTAGAAAGRQCPRQPQSHHQKKKKNHAVEKATKTMVIIVQCVTIIAASRHLLQAGLTILN